MPNGRMTLVADDANADLAAALRERLDLDEDNGPAADILLTAATPQQQAGHVVVTGALTDELDDWDRQVPPQTLAGALWVAPDQDPGRDQRVAPEQREVPGRAGRQEGVVGMIAVGHQQPVQIGPRLRGEPVEGRVVRARHGQRGRGRAARSASSWPVPWSPPDASSWWRRC